MKEQVLDIWADLRERRLWPVAVALVVALVAVPVVLVKPAEEVPSQAATSASAAGSGDPLAKQSLVKAFEAKPLVAISKLDQFSAKDPFKPIEQLQPLTASNVVAVTGNGAGATSGGAGAPSGGSTPSAGNPTSTPGTGGGQGGTTPKPTTPKKYTYVVDLTFRAGKDSQRYQSFNRLGMLPSQASPLLVYLGVDGTASQAAFLVDSTLDASGDGQCRPSATSCGVVYMRPGEKETFTDGKGHSYELLLDQIRKVLVTSKTAHARAGSVDKNKPTRQQPRRFLFPVLIDLVTGGQP